MTAFTAPAAPVARVSIPLWFVSPQALTALILFLLVLPFAVAALGLLGDTLRRRLRR